jgi:hypothetical protein
VNDLAFLAPAPGGDVSEAPIAGATRYLVLPEVVVPLDQPQVFRYALSSWLLPPTRAKAARNAVLAALSDRARFPRRLGGQVWAQGPKPFLVAAAEGLGAGAVGGWLLTPGGSDALSRNVFHLFGPGATKPHAVLKFARMPGYTDPFDRDERALKLVAATGGTVAEHAPRLLARDTVEGLAVSVETAAPGPRLLSYLTSRAPLTDRRDALLRVARWTIDVARETRGRGPAVFAHNDLGTWNVLVHGRDHVAVDWESATADGLPLNDLTYLLFYGFANVAGVAPDEEFFRALFAGERPESATLFALVRECAAASGLTDEQIGPLVTESWERHGRSHVARGAALDAHAPGTAAATTVPARCAEVWRTDPRLGPGWTPGWTPG